jgi:hypothetical protein
MRKVSIKKISLLGLILLAASAVTGAALPNNRVDENQFVGDGSVTTSTTPGDGFGDFTCMPTIASVKNCDLSFFSGTTNGFIPTEGYTTIFV